MSTAEVIENGALDQLGGMSPRSVGPAEMQGAGAADLQRYANLGRLTVGMAHDLRSALAAAQANLNYLADQLGSDKPAGELVEAARDAQSAIDRALTAAANVLALARVRRGPMSSISPVEEIRQAIAAAEPSVRWQPVRIELDAGRAPFVLAEPGALMQVLLSLLLNSLDRAVARGGSVRVGLNEDDGMMAISIAHHPMREPMLLGRRGGVRELDPAGLGYSLSCAIIKSFGGEVLNIEHASGVTEFIVRLRRA
ncbi:MAG: HAMP domain-containing histidine kinase [Deltaproteobacteria bacterium]|nr:HAMP domain-containing histidine kinase [Deltaproteobacteria bacterium]